jgi:hypothetical protein
MVSSRFHDPILELPVRDCTQMPRPNLSLNLYASPAALARRPLGAGYLGSLGELRE